MAMLAMVYDRYVLSVSSNTAANDRPVLLASITTPPPPSAYSMPLPIKGPVKALARRYYPFLRQGQCQVLSSGGTESMVI